MLYFLIDDRPTYVCILCGSEVIGRVYLISTVGVIISGTYSWQWCQESFKLVLIFLTIFIHLHSSIFLYIVCIHVSNEISVRFQTSRILQIKISCIWIINSKFKKINFKDDLISPWQFTKKINLFAACLKNRNSNQQYCVYL